ncbi:MAG: radical SAM protein [Bryobacteraceae bacterium]|nr:radical SAM protein [Bryobacteraceae bacterium]
MLFPDAHAPRLIGIAKMAAGSRALEEKRRVEYREIETRSFIGRCSGGDRMPFRWTVNPYRGCEFGCHYCYARYTHEFMELRDGRSFETRIFAKQWNAGAFARELKRIPLGEWIAIGTATDPYQPAERRFRVTRGILEAFAKESGYRVSIISKSDLIARDADLFADIARKNELRVNVTITTMDEGLARALEPYAPRPSLRIAAAEKLASRGLKVCVFCAPVLPMINDSERSLDAVARAAAAAGATSFGGNILFLKSCSRQIFLPFLKERFPALAQKYETAYRETAYLKGAYPERIRERIREIRERHGLTQAMDYRPEQWPEGQLSLFE